MKTIHIILDILKMLGNGITENLYFFFIPDFVVGNIMKFSTNSIIPTSMNYSTNSLGGDWRYRDDAPKKQPPKQSEEEKISEEILALEKQIQNLEERKNSLLQKIQKE